MNPAHAHLLINHVPILGSVLATLAVGWGRLRRRPEVERAGLIAFAVSGATAIPTYLAGKAAAPMLVGLSSAARTAVEAHQRSALPALAALLAAGVVAVVALALSRRSATSARRLALIALVVGAISAGLSARAGNLGGEIRHPEIHQDAGLAG